MSAKRKSFTSKAFTIVELLVVLAIMSTLMVGIFQSIVQLGKSTAETRNMTQSQIEIMQFVQNVRILVFNSFQGQFRVGGQNTGAESLTLAANPTPVNDTVFLRLSSTTTDTINGWGKVIYDPGTRTIYWVNQIDATNRSVTSQGSENWQALITRVVRTDFETTNQEPVFKFVLRNFPLGTVNQSNVGGLFVRCKVLMRSTSKSASTQDGEPIAVETTIPFANII